MEARCVPVDGIREVCEGRGREEVRERMRGEEDNNVVM